MPSGFSTRTCLPASRAFSAAGDVELVGDRDDDRLDLGIGQHRVVVAIGDLRLVDRGHALAQVVGQVADGVQLGVARLAAGVEVSELGDRAAAQNADPQAAIILGDHDDLPRIALPQRLAKRGQVLPLGERRQGRQVLLHRDILELARAMDLDRLEHRLEADPRVGLAALVLDRVDRRAGQEQHVLGDPLATRRLGG